MQFDETSQPQGNHATTQNTFETALFSILEQCAQGPPFSTFALNSKRPCNIIKKKTIYACLMARAYFFPNCMECHIQYLGYFSISLEKITF